MKRSAPLLALICCYYWLFAGCNTPSPENYFDLAVLNCNVMTGFANDGLQRELDNPTVKMAEGNNNKAVPMKRKEVIDSKIQFLEANFKKIKQLKETWDTEDLLRASEALNEYVLPVYKNEYKRLAKLYDTRASKKEIQSLIQSIHDKYYPGFDELYNKLITAGKSYAARHNIKVNWGT